MLTLAQMQEKLHCQEVRSANPSKSKFQLRGKERGKKKRKQKRKTTTKKQGCNACLFTGTQKGDPACAP
jgi:hypothetical protein